MTSLDDLLVRVRKDHANYRKAYGKKRCGNCSMFIPKHKSCTLVIGYIDQDDVCDYWAEKTKGETPKEEKKEAPSKISLSFLFDME